MAVQSEVHHHTPYCSDVAKASSGHRWWAAAAAAVGFIMVGVYLTVIDSQGNDGFADVAPWALAMAFAATIAAVAAFRPADRASRTLLMIAAVLFLGIGVVSIFSLGLGFLAAGAMSLVGASQTPRSAHD